MLDTLVIAQLRGELPLCTSRPRLISIEGLQSVVEGGALTRDDVQPNIILLHIGTNNMYGSHPAQPAELLPSLLDEIIAACPDALLVVAQIIPYNGVESYNAAIPEIVQ